MKDVLVNFWGGLLSGLILLGIPSVIALVKRTKTKREGKSKPNNYEQLGLIGVYRNRDEAFEVFHRHVGDEPESISIVALCLDGLPARNRSVVESWIKSAQNVSILLTHPKFADLFWNPPTAPHHYARRVIGSLERLHTLGIDCKDVKLYNGTPSLFGIKTEKYMLINPYPYVGQAHDAPCLIVEHLENLGRTALYDAYDSKHFDVFDNEGKCSLTYSITPKKVGENSYETFRREIEELKAMYPELFPQAVTL